MADKIDLIVNGETKTFENIKTLSDFVAVLSDTLPKMYVIEQNEQIIYKEDYALTAVNAGDRIEIAEFAGGG